MDYFEKLLTDEFLDEQMPGTNVTRREYINTAYDATLKENPKVLKEYIDKADFNLGGVVMKRLMMDDSPKAFPAKLTWGLKSGKLKMFGLIPCEKCPACERMKERMKMKWKQKNTDEDDKYELGDDEKIIINI